MIDKLRAIAVFSTVVEQGSFRAAARHLGLAPSRISETVSRLEADLGVSLLYRSTRRLALTNEGRTLHAQAVLMLAAAERGIDAVNPPAGIATGTLRVTAPAFVTQTDLMGRLAAFVRAHPGVDVLLDFSDRPRDLIRDGYDVSIRAGWLEDSAHRSRSIGTARRCLMASPSYCAGRPVPVHPRDLEDWDWIRFAMRPDRTELTSEQGETVGVTGRSNVKVNAAAALYEFAVRGLGVTAIPEHLARRGLARGDLVEVLPTWHLRPLGLYAVWPKQVRRENLTTLFVAALSEPSRERTTVGAPDGTLP